jgi:hypothetical protein
MVICFGEKNYRMIKQLLLDSNSGETVVPILDNSKITNTLTTMKDKVTEYFKIDLEIFYILNGYLMKLMVTDFRNLKMALSMKVSSNLVREKVLES